MENFDIRPADINDCQNILRLIKELADYEKMPDGPKLDLETFKADGFGKDAFYKCFVAVTCGDNDVSKAKEVVGYALYYFTYSTWEGRSIYMEDLYVTPKCRHQGIGQRLWKEVVKEGLQKGCTRTDFAVLGWNTPAIELYKKKGAYDLTTKEDWHLFRMDRQQMMDFTQIMK